MTQLNSTQFETENQYLQAEIDSQNRVAELRRQLDALKKQLDLAYKVVSPYSGQVLEVKVNPGALVSSATPIISVQPNLRELEAVVYIRAKDAKGIQADMDVEVSPTNTKREEFGFIRAKVVSVADYPATEAALMRIFQNAPLAQSLAADGPVTEVRVRMLEDANTPSGFKWSSALGAPVKITGGMLVTAQIVVREQIPATLVIPKIRETFGLS
jgi:HlyD family secretion protein